MRPLDDEIIGQDAYYEPFFLLHVFNLGPKLEEKVVSVSVVLDGSEQVSEALDLF